MSEEIKTLLLAMREDIKEDFRDVKERIDQINGRVQEHSKCLAVIKDRDKRREWTFRGVIAAVLGLVGKLVYDVLSKGK